MNIFISDTVSVSSLWKIIKKIYIKKNALGPQEGDPLEPVHDHVIPVGSACGPFPVVDIRISCLS